MVVAYKGDMSLRGPHDLAAHSARGRRTKRTEVMFGPHGRAYVYQLYGTSWAMNLVVGEEGEPHAVLIRAIEPVRGLELIADLKAKEGVTTEAALKYFCLVVLNLNEFVYLD